MKPTNVFATKGASNGDTYRLRQDAHSRHREVRPADGPKGLPGQVEAVLLGSDSRSSGRAGYAAAAGVLAPFVELITDAVAERIGEQLEKQLVELSSVSPALVDRQGLAQLLACSVPTVDRLRAEGMPELRLGDSPRFEPDRVLDWLRERERDR